jgi:DNA-binding transcriptional regulator YiaG
VDEMKNIRMRLADLSESHDTRECAGCEKCDEIHQLRVQLGITKPNQKEEVKVLAKFEMTVEEFVDLRFVQKLSFLKIAQLKGVSDATIHVWKNNNQAAIDAALKRLNISDSPKPTKEEKPMNQEVSPKIVEKYETEIRLLKERVAEMQGRSDADKLAIKALKVENEVLKENQSLHVDADRLSEENQLLKGLLKHYL